MIDGEGIRGSSGRDGDRPLRATASALTSRSRGRSLSNRSGGYFSLIRLGLLGGGRSGVAHHASKLACRLLLL